MLAVLRHVLILVCMTMVVGCYSTIENKSEIIDKRFQTDQIEHIKSANRFFKSADYKKAYDLYKNFIQVTQIELADPWTGGTARLGKSAERYTNIEEDPLNPHLIAYKRLGDICRLWGQYDVAKDWYVKCLQLSERILIASSGDYMGSKMPFKLEANYYIGESYRCLGQLYSDQGAYNKASNYFKRAIDHDSKLGEKRLLAKDYNLMSMLLEKIGYYEDSLSYIKLSLQLHQADPDEKSINWIGIDFQRQGQIYRSMGNYAEALNLFDRAEKIFSTHLYKEDLGKCLADMGGVYLELGDYEKALASYKNVLHISVNAGNKQIEMEALYGIGIVYNYLGQLDTSKESISEALKLAMLLKNRENIAKLESSLSSVYKSSGDYENALKYGISSYGISKEFGSMNVVGNLLLIADVYLSMDKLQEAAKYLDQAGLILQNFDRPELQWYYYNILGKLQLRNKQSQLAVTSYKKSIEIIESVRSKLRVDTFKTGFLGNKMELYDQIIEVLIGLGQKEEAINYVERAKARTLVDMLAQVNFSEKEPESNINFSTKEKGLRNQLAAVQNLIDKESTIKDAAGIRSSIIRGYDEDLNRLQREYRSVQIAMKRKNPEFASLIAVDPLTGKDIVDIAGKDSMLLQYYITKNKLYIFSIQKSTVETHEIHLKKEILEEWVREFRNGITHFDKKKTDQFAKILYDHLIKPIEKNRQGSNVIILPHGILHYLPFAALKKENKYLIEMFAIGYAPSATVLKYCMDKSKTLDFNILAFGNPDLGNPALDLPSAEIEVNQIKKIFPTASIFIKKDANKANILPMISQYGILHFATHGEYNEKFPMFSSLRLSPQGSDDGRLTANDIFSIRTKASLVVLSACQTGLGKITSGDEVIGMNRAFMYAGASTVISSLWSINPEITAKLMQKFYVYLKSSSRIEALRKAQVAILRASASEKQETFTLPFYWAAFCLNGAYM